MAKVTMPIESIDAIVDAMMIATVCAIPEVSGYRPVAMGIIADVDHVQSSVVIFDAPDGVRYFAVVSSDDNNTVDCYPMQ